MNILITGGNGFLGSNLAKKFLEQGHKVIILDLKKNKFSLKNPKAKFIKCDLTKIKSINQINFRGKIDIILHCAGQPSAALSFKNPEKDLNLNILSTLNTLLLAEKIKVKKFIFASTFNVYEENNLTPELKETSNCKPKSLYAASKLSAENYIKCVCERNQISWNILRMFNIYGPGQDPTNKSLGMINIFLTMALNSDSIEVKGSLKRFRDFIYIDDVASAWFKIATSKKTINKIYNIGTGKKTSIKNLLNLIIKLTNKKISINETKGTPGDFLGCYANIDKLKKDTKFSPKVDLNYGLKKFYNWARQII